MSWPFDAKVAIARFPSPSLRTIALSVEVKNHMGLRSPSSSAVIGRACPSSTPSSPNIIVMSDFSAFQNLASISCGVGMAVLLVASISNGERAVWFLNRR